MCSKNIVVGKGKKKSEFDTMPPRREMSDQSSPGSRTYRTDTARPSRSTTSASPFPPRKMVGVIGPDGVGKSSLLASSRVCSGSSKGEVFVFGDDLARSARVCQGVRGRIAYMPQGLGRNLYPTLSVFENIDFFGRLFGQGRKRTARAHHRTADRHQPGKIRGRGRPESFPAA